MKRKWRRESITQQTAVTLWKSIAAIALGFLSLEKARSSDGIVDLTALPNYANQAVPSYIERDNTPDNNAISDAGAILGRVLFYDKRLSRNETISCASCHRQENAFGDPSAASTGVSGLTARHSMRLVNIRFGQERRMFWDERATSVEDQSTRPIHDHIEMGFSGTNGDPRFDELVERLSAIETYQVLFTVAFGTSQITETRMQRALAQFVRSIQSYDSRFDQGREVAGSDRAPFPNFSASENRGKTLFLDPPGRGAGCAACHRPPEFDITPGSGNNGVTGSLSGGRDLAVTRSPSLRDLVAEDGTPHGPMMHDASLLSLLDVINHYDRIDSDNPELDRRLRGRRGPGVGQNLNLSTREKLDLVAFMRTLTGRAVYTDKRWSDPFDSHGHLSLILLPSSGLEIRVTNEAERPMIEVAMNGAPNIAYVLQSSGDLNEWRDVMEVQDESGRLSRIVPIRDERQRLFYRYVFRP